MNEKSSILLVIIDSFPSHYMTLFWEQVVWKNLDLQDFSEVSIKSSRIANYKYTYLDDGKFN